MSSLTLFLQLLYLLLFVFDKEIDAHCSDLCRFGAEYCNGECLYGCEAGHTGLDCQQPCTIDRCVECYENGDSQICTHCQAGYHGSLCQHRCSKHCKFGDKKCDMNGRCFYGCEHGFYGDDCESIHCNISNCLQCGVSYSNEFYCKRCHDGMYYDYSRKRCVNCSLSCKKVSGGPSCNSTTGICIRGCKDDAYFGMVCDKKCHIANCSKCRENPYNSYKTHCEKCNLGFYTDEEKLQCLKCSEHCSNGYEGCDPYTGHCQQGCEKGWLGSRCDKSCNVDHCDICAINAFENHIVCQKCSPGYYVNDFSCVQCSKYCKNHCHASSGYCVDGCVGNRYGKYCEVLCSKNCVNGTCDVATGTCIYGCNEGWYSDNCDRKCPKECADCQPFLNTKTCYSCNAGWYGTLCEEKCSENCKRSNFNSYLYCNKDTGKCRDGCNNGYYGENCNLNCSKHCTLHTCNRSNGKCRYKCTGNRYGDYCEQKCPDHCLNLHSYELTCNSVTGQCRGLCNDGFYGDFCNKTCPSNCKDSKCAKVPGTCSNGCLTNYHGKFCNLTCASYCKSRLCEQNSGDCSLGCLDGSFGADCKQSCNQKCKGSVCHMDTGHCTNGCEDGFYGDTCEMICSSNCLNRTCNKQGICMFGCIKDRRGPRCSITVIPAPDYASDSSGTSTIAVASSVTAAVLLTVLVIVIVAVIVRRKSLQTCAKNTRSRTSIDSVNTPVETFGFTMENIQENSPLMNGKQNFLQLNLQDLQIYDELAGSRGLLVCQIKSGKYGESLVHVKVVHKGCGKQNQKLFVHEVDILRKLPEHIHVVSLIGFCYDQDYMYHVFKPCDRGDLLRYLQRLRHATPDWQNVAFKSCFTELMQFTLDILTGLQFIHENNIIHRLITSTNIYIDSENVAKLGNFYYALASPSDEVQASIEMSEIPSEFKPWMSIESQGRNIFSYETDVWTFGVLLWEMSSMGENLMDQATLSPKMAPFQPPQGCDRLLYRIMEQCWRTTPSTRPTISELQDKINALLERNKLEDYRATTV